MARYRTGPLGAAGAPPHTIVDLDPHDPTLNLPALLAAGHLTEPDGDGDDQEPAPPPRPRRRPAR